MAKKDFSGSVSASLSTRSAAATRAEQQKAEITLEPRPTSTVSETLDFKNRSDKGLGLNKDGTFRQSNAGRKVKDSKAKKQHYALYLRPETISRINSHAEEIGMTGTQFIGQYIERHLDDILE